MPEREAYVRDLMVRSITTPVSLLMLSSGALLSIQPQTLIGGALTLVVCVGLAWRRMHSPRFVREARLEHAAQRSRRLLFRLDEVARSLDPQLSGVLRGILDSQERLFGILGGEVESMLACRTETGAVLEKCASLLDRRQSLTLFLASLDVPAVQKEALELERKALAAHDDVSRRHYEQSARLKQRELENYVRVRDTVQRIDSQLVAVQCTFDHLVSKAASWKAAELSSGDTSEASVTQELAELNARIRSLDDGVAETLAVGARS